MAVNSQENESLDVPMLRGRQLYESNPSVQGRFTSRMTNKTLHKGSGHAYMVASDTGEVLGHGAFGFIEEKEVDNAEFVKVYLDGIKKFGELSKAGATLFEFLYSRLSGLQGKDRDTVNLNYYLAKKWKPDLARRTYTRGLGELLDKEFLFKSVAADVYFVNLRFMFNGDRMVVVRAYRRAGSSLQTELPFKPAPTMLNAPNVQSNDDSNRTEQQDEQ